VLVIDHVSANVCVVTGHHLTHKCEFAVYLLPQSKIDPNAGHSSYVTFCPRPFFLCDILSILPCLSFLVLGTHCPFYRVSVFLSLVHTVHFTVSQFSYPWYTLSILPCISCLVLGTHCPFYRVSIFLSLVHTVHFTVSQFSYPWYTLSILPYLSFLILGTHCPFYRVSVFLSLVHTVHFTVSQLSYP